MIRWIVGTSLRFRFLVLLASVALLWAGMTRLPKMPMDAFPEFAPPRVEIQTPCLGLSADEVESYVSVPMEHSLNGIAGLDILRSKSVPDLSSIEMYFKPGTDELAARQLVQERVATIVPTLPTWAAPPVMMPPISTTGRFLKIGVSSDSIPLTDLSMIAYWTIRAKLLLVPGVANVAIWGERIKMPEVLVDPKRMREHNVSLDEAMGVTADALDVGLLQFSNGSVDRHRRRDRHPEPTHHGNGLVVRFSAQGTGPDAHPTKKKADGTPLVLNDRRERRRRHWPLFGDAIIDDGQGLMLVVMKYPWRTRSRHARRRGGAEGLKPVSTA
jgi:multidrug efflux pump subunit AcrB